MYSPLQFPLNVEQSERGRSSVLLSPERPMQTNAGYIKTSVREVTVSAAELWGSANCRQETLFETGWGWILAQGCSLQGFSTDT